MVDVEPVLVEVPVPVDESVLVVEVSIGRIGSVSRPGFLPFADIQQVELTAGHFRRDDHEGQHCGEHPSPWP